MIEMCWHCAQRLIPLMFRYLLIMLMMAMMMTQILHASAVTNNIVDAKCLTMVLAYRYIIHSIPYEYV